MFELAHILLNNLDDITMIIIIIQRLKVIISHTFSQIIQNSEQQEITV